MYYFYVFHDSYHLLVLVYIYFLVKMYKVSLDVNFHHLVFISPYMLFNVLDSKTS
jgi:hypothetical protein